MILAKRLGTLYRRPCQPTGTSARRRTTPELSAPTDKLGASNVAARGPHPGRAKNPQTVAATGETEIEALRDLNARLRGSGMPGGEWTISGLGLTYRTADAGLREVHRHTPYAPAGPNGLVCTNLGHDFAEESKGRPVWPWH